MDFNRTLDLHALVEKKSHFLFGPRSTGKSTLIRQTLPNYQIIDLLDSNTRLRLLQRPADLKNMLRSDATGFVIDEVQKIPELLDEVHWLIENKKFRFLLTGSSARKLKRGAANLLAGRARTANLFPLTYNEIPDFNLERALSFGLLPSIYNSDDPWDDLKAYVDNYLKEEVLEESLVRNLGNYSRFLFTAATQSGQLLNYSAVASDAQLSEGTVRSYYQILSDTLIGDVLEPWRESKKRKAIQTAKFYYFDIGVTHALLDIRTLPPHSDTYGRAFEAWILMELKAYISYRRLHKKLTYWRSVNKQEVDFCIGNEIAIETKIKRNVSSRDLIGLRALKEEKVFKKYYLVSFDPIETNNDGIQCVFWKNFIEALWANKIVEF